MRVWRLCQAKFASEALDGDGGLFTSGRWHARGVRVVYTSATLSLAALEMLAHARRIRTPQDLVAVEIDLPESLAIVDLRLAKLPPGWDAYPAPASTARLGMDWLAAGRTAVLGVPSAVILCERNFVLNPAHPSFGRIRVVDRIPFSFDTRLLMPRRV